MRGVQMDKYLSGRDCDLCTRQLSVCLSCPRMKYSQDVQVSALRGNILLETTEQNSFSAPCTPKGIVLVHLLL